MGSYTFYFGFPVLPTNIFRAIKCSCFRITVIVSVHVVFLFSLLVFQMTCKIHLLSKTATFKNVSYKRISHSWYDYEAAKVLLLKTWNVFTIIILQLFIILQVPTGGDFFLVLVVGIISKLNKSIIFFNFPRVIRRQQVNLLYKS